MNQTQTLEICAKFTSVREWVGKCGKYSSLTVYEGIFAKCQWVNQWLQESCRMSSLVNIFLEYIAAKIIPKCY